MEFTFEGLEILHHKFALAAADALLKLSNVLISVRSNLSAHAMRHTVLPLAIEDSSILHGELALPSALSLHKLAFVDVAFWRGKFAHTFW